MGEAQNMDFIIHLAILFGGLIWLVWLVAEPRWCLGLTCSVVAGYIGSEAGFLGTVIGLAVGGAVGGLGASIAIALLSALWSFVKWMEIPRASLTASGYGRIRAALKADGISPEDYRWRDAWERATMSAEREHAQSLRQPEDGDGEWRKRVEEHNRNARVRRQDFEGPD